MTGSDLVVTIARKMQSAIYPLITDPLEAEELGAVTADKGGGHTAHELDTRAEAVLFGALKEAGYAGRLFSEESGLVHLGDEPRLIVSDPYCNTTITFRGIRESAVAVYEYTLGGHFVAGAIADLQIPRIVWSAADQGAAVTLFRSFSDVLPGSEEITRPVHCSSTRNVGSSFLTISMMKRNRRQDPPLRLLREAAMVGIVDGAIAAARLALGETDGFVDAEVGQPGYEALAYALVAKAGGVVSDPAGSRVHFGRIAAELAEGEVRRHAIVAGATQALLDEILARIPAAE